jgi:Lysozyme like domain
MIFTRQQITPHATAAGFTGRGLSIAVAIAFAESSGKTDARLVNADGSIDRGLWQINSRWHPEVTDAMADDPATAAREAFRISKSGADFTPWATFKSGAYRRYLDPQETAMLPTLDQFLAVLDEDLNTVQERANGTTIYGDEREAHYPRMVTISNGTVFPLTWPTDWCSIKAGHAYAKAAGWPAAWPLPATMFYTPTDVAQWKAAGQWIDGPNSGQPGDFIYFDWADADRLANHVGVVREVTASSYIVHEGNVGTPSVQYRRAFYPRSISILGFGRPQFATDPPQETDEMPIPSHAYRFRGTANVFTSTIGNVVHHSSDTLDDWTADQVAAGSSPDVKVIDWHAQTAASFAAKAGLSLSAFVPHPTEPFPSDLTKAR